VTASSADIPRPPVRVWQGTRLLFQRPAGTIVGVLALSNMRWSGTNDIEGLARGTFNPKAVSSSLTSGEAHIFLRVKGV
jgi:hypothetical protein